MKNTQDRLETLEMIKSFMGITKNLEHTLEHMIKNNEMIKGLVD